MHYAILRFIKKIKLIPKEILWWAQKKVRGFGFSDLWDIRSFHSPLMLRYMEEFRDNMHGYPAVITEKEWDEILEEIIFAFRWWAYEEEALHSAWRSSADSEALHLLLKKGNERAHKGLHLFAEWYPSIWD